MPEPHPHTPGTPPSPRRRDPRLYQIAVLSSLLLYGFLALGFEFRPKFVVTVVATALLTQWLCGRWVGLPRFDPRSPLISSLSLALLLRTHELEIAAFAAFVAIASKFVVRFRGKHVFNPTNFGIGVALLTCDAAWVSPGQWGTAALLAFFLAGAGGVVTLRADRGDVTWAFLASYAGLLFGRTLWLGDPWVIPLHQLSSGALLVFAFFMISDPKTTPDHRAGRVLYAAVVALVAATIRFGLHRPNDLLWALLLCAPLVPWIDRWLPATRYRWTRSVATWAAPKPSTSSELPTTPSPKPTMKPQGALS